MGASYMVEEDTGKEGGLGCGLVMSQQTAGNLLIGASWRKTGYDKRTIQEEIELMAKVNVRAMPMLKTASVSFAPMPIFSPIPRTICQFWVRLKVSKDLLWHRVIAGMGSVWGLVRAN
jgi:hypothetical protein